MVKHRAWPEQPVITDVDAVERVNRKLCPVVSGAGPEDNGPGDLDLSGAGGGRRRKVAEMERNGDVPLCIVGDRWGGGGSEFE